jgi:glycolate oxidase iron-sulfur subunit
MRAVHFEGHPVDETFVRFMELCVMCRACEAACPSSVPFGHLMEGAREAVVANAPARRRWARAGYHVLGRHRLLLAGSTALAVLQRLRLAPRGLPRLPLRRPKLVPTGDDVWLFTGCVMDAWMRPVHAAVLRVLSAAGAGVALPGPDAACCGALHAHAGLTGGARTLAERVMAAMPGEAPVLVDSAGCGATLKDYGRLLGTPEAARFASRVRDVSEWLAPRVGSLPAARRRRDAPMAIQDPCHLRHVQHAHEHVRTVLHPFVDLVELDDEGLCCGAGGAYAAQHADLAGAIRDRKVDAVRRAGATAVVSANPGCAMHLAAAGLVVRHPFEVIDDALGGADGG